MDKIIIVGHPSSGLEPVESMLRSWGMKPALPSRREGLLPSDIHRTLRKIHQLPEVGSITDEQDFYPGVIAPVWQSMAMDLLLGNLDRRPWGWADPDTLFFLDYWQQLDPACVFVFVYNSPASVLHALAANPTLPKDETSVCRALDNWAAYNSAMLRFHLRHQDRCVLVHSGQMQNGSRLALSEIQTPLSVVLDTISDAEMADRMPSVEYASHNEGNRLSAIPDVRDSGTNMDTPTAEFLIDSLLASHPQHACLYDELQSVANLSCLDSPPDASDLCSKAWFSWIQERSQTSASLHDTKKRCVDLEAQFKHLKQAHRLDFLQLSQAQEELEVRMSQFAEERRRILTQAAEARHSAEILRHSLQEQQQVAKKSMEELQESQQAVEQLHKRNVTLEAALEQLRMERHLTFLQISQVREEFDLILIENSRLRVELEALRMNTADGTKGVIEPSSTPPRPTGAADRVKSQLSYRLGSLIVQKSKSPAGWICLPFLLIDETLEFNRIKRAGPTVSLPPIHEYADADEAKRVKYHLSYRLGNTLVRRAKSPIGWFVMPFAMLRQIQAFRRRIQRNK